MQKKYLFRSSYTGVFLYTMFVTNIICSLFSCSSEQDIRTVDPIVETKMVSNKKVALVVGNSAYIDGLLKNPVNDAEDFSIKLANSGFEIIKRTNTSKSVLLNAIQTFRKSLEQGGTGLFFYAGHGIQINGVNYLVPVDARMNTLQDVHHNGVSIQIVLDAMEKAKNRLNLIFLDACRNNPFLYQTRSVMKKGLADMNAPDGTFIAYATEPGAVAYDGVYRNSPFTGALLENFGTPGEEIEDYFKRVIKNVKQKTESQQNPWSSSNITNSFCFVPLDSEASPQSRPAKTQISKTGKLREKAELNLSKEVVKRMLIENQFYDKDWNSTGGIEQDYQLVENNRDIVIDTTYKLMWQRSGSKLFLTYSEAERYVSDLNIAGFGGYKDWRLPTLEEAASLLKSEPNSYGYYTPELFKRTQTQIWTCDRQQESISWSVNYLYGDCEEVSKGYKTFVRAVRTLQPTASSRL